MILCIDDEPVGLFIRRLLLESVGYKVITATNGKDGLELFTANPITAVLLDYSMPEMNGGEVAAEMKRRKPQVPILMLSACLEIPAEALSRVDGRVFKGDPPASLLAMVKQLAPNSDSLVASA
jgi:CheY-like chemotaxis protein